MSNKDPPKPGKPRLTPANPENQNAGKPVKSLLHVTGSILDYPVKTNP